MKTVKEKRRFFLKKLGITLVIPLFMMVIGLMMMLIPCWNLISEAANVSSLIFYNTDIEIDQMQFMINGELMVST